MNLPKFVRTTALIVTTLVAVLLGAVLLVMSGRPVLQIVRAALFLAAMVGFAVTFIMLFGNLRGTRPVDAKELLVSTGGATMCLLAAWMLTNMLL